MTKLRETRPFNLEHARAGAPVAMLNGWPLEIFKWDSQLPGFPIVGMCGEGSTLRQAAWTVQGGYGPSGTSTFDLAMTPLGYIDGKPVFVGDKLVMTLSGQPIEAHALLKQAQLDGCTWAAPEKVYPETKMSGPSLVEVHERALNRLGPTGGRHGAVLAVANAALRHAIDAGQVVVPIGGIMKPEEIAGEIANDIQARRKRDMAIAEAVQSACYVAAMNCQAGHEATSIRKVHLTTIIEQALNEKVPA